jgi:hypothetical protein
MNALKVKRAKQLLGLLGKQAEATKALDKSARALKAATGREKRLAFDAMKAALKHSRQIGTRIETVSAALKLKVAA